MLSHALPRHLQVPTEPPKRLTILPVKHIQETPAAGIGERLEDQVNLHATIICKRLLACQTRSGPDALRFQIILLTDFPGP